MTYLFLIDGNNLCVRGWFKNIQPKQMITNIINYIKNNYKNIYPDFANEDKLKCYICFDKEESKLVRQKFYSEYKNKKQDLDVNLINQINELSKLKYFLNPNIKVFSNPNLEADDIIANFCKFKPDNCKITIVSNDSDFKGLINNDIQILKHNQIYTVNNLINDYTNNIYKNNINIYHLIKGLVGDNSDNIKGVTSIGDKTSLKVIENIEYNSFMDAFNIICERIRLYFKNKNKDTDFIENEVKNYYLACKTIYPLYQQNISEVLNDS